MLLNYCTIKKTLLVAFVCGSIHSSFAQLSDAATFAAALQLLVAMGAERCVGRDCRKSRIACCAALNNWA